MVCVAVGGIQAKRAAGCLQRREAGAGPSLRRQSRLPPRRVRKWSSVWDCLEVLFGTTALLLFRPVLGIQSAGALHAGRG